MTTQPDRDDAQHVMDAGTPFDPTLTILEALEQSAQTFPDRIIRMHDSRCRVVGERHYADMLVAARAMAGKLQALGVMAGDRVLINLANSWTWYDVWLGALYIGALPVAISPGFLLSSAKYQQEKVLGTADRLAAKLLITDTRLRDHIGPKSGAVLVRTTEELAGVDAAPVQSAHPTNPQDTAYLQLTSGSTGVPKAAMISHLGVRHNIWATHQALLNRYGAPAQTGVFWLPLFHDFGLIMTLGSLVQGHNLLVYPPAAFLSRPAEWLRQLAEWPAVLSAFPNFALRRLAAQADALKAKEVDLSQWQSAIVAAEMNRATSFDAFEQALAPLGLGKTVLTPAYGMAETTLLVTLDQTPAMPASDHAMTDDPVTCGEPLDQVSVRVRDTQGNVLPDDKVGEVEVRTPDLLTGYFAVNGSGAAVDEEGWFATGDLGFLKDRTLYLTGRKKDVMIVNGANIMPHEIEALAEDALDAADLGRAAAYSVAGPNGDEQIVIVIEVDKAQDQDVAADLSGKITQAISHELGLSISRLEFVQRGWIPRTSSGKIQRDVLRRKEISGLQA